MNDDLSIWFSVEIGRASRGQKIVARRLVRLKLRKVVGLIEKKRFRVMRSER